MDVAVKRSRKALKKIDKIAKTATAAEIQERARKAGIYAIKAMEEIVKNPISTDVARISAANTLLDRGYGKAVQATVNTQVNPDGAPTEISQQELDRRIKETITRIEGLTTRKRETLKSEERPVDIRKLN